MCIDGREALEHALATRIHLRFFLPRIEIVGARLSEDALRETRDRVHRLADACGCGEGAFAVLAALGVYSLYALTLGPELGVWGHVWRTVMLTLAAATIGKLVGLARARFQLHRELCDLRAAFPTSLRPENSHAHGLEASTT